MSEIIILNHCVPYPKGEFKPNFSFEIREEDKSEKKEVVGKDLKAEWLDERIDPNSLPDNLVAFYLRFNGESLYTYLVYTEPKACDFCATLIVEKNSPTHKALDGAYIIDTRYPNSGLI